MSICQKENFKRKSHDKEEKASSHLEDAVAVLRQGRGRVGGVHLRELLGKVADVQLVPDHGLERRGHLLGCQVLPVNFLE